MNCPGNLGLGRLNTLGVLAGDFLETTPLLDYSGHPVPEASCQGCQKQCFVLLVKEHFLDQ